MATDTAIPADTSAADTAAADTAAAEAGRSATRRQIRGSSLLLAGRLLAKGANFVVHILTVRYLSRSDYGAIAYAVALASLGEHVGSLGLHRAVSRFVPIYLEQRDYRRAGGTIALALVVIIALGALCIAVVYGARDLIARYLIHDELAASLLLILVFLSPLNALDTLFSGMLAVFTSPRAIFLRRYVVAPVLKIVVILLVIAAGLGVRALGLGYLIAGLIGVALYAVILARAMRANGLLPHLAPASATIPWREIAAYTFPLLTTDLVYLLLNSAVILLLGYYGGTDDVAVYRAVWPVATLNELVFLTFGLLFAPQAARLFARNDRRGMHDFYWHTAAWMSVLTLPIFICTFSLSGTVTRYLFGPQYAESSSVLALLALGYYLHAAFGFNGTTLAVCGQVRCMFRLSLLVAAVNVVANLVLIPRYGVLGAAITSCGTLIVHNVLKQYALAAYTGVGWFDRRYTRVYATILLGSLGLLAVQRVADLGVIYSVILTGLVFVLSVRLSRDLLSLDDTFPELRRLPLVRTLFPSSTKPVP